MSWLVKNENELSDVVRCAEVIRCMEDTMNDSLENFLGAYMNWEFFKGWIQLLEEKGIVKDGEDFCEKVRYMALITEDSLYHLILNTLGLTDEEIAYDKSYLPYFLISLYFSSNPEMYHVVYQEYKNWVIEDYCLDWETSYRPFTPEEKEICNNWKAL